MKASPVLSSHVIISIYIFPVLLMHASLKMIVLHPQVLCPMNDLALVPYTVMYHRIRDGMYFQEVDSPALTAWLRLSTLNVTPPKRLKGGALATPITRKSHASPWSWRRRSNQGTPQVSPVISSHLRMTAWVGCGCYCTEQTDPTVSTGKMQKIWYTN